MSTVEGSCLISFARAPPTWKDGTEAKNSNWKYLSQPGIESAILCILAGHLDRLVIETVHYMCFKLVQYSEMTGYAWGVSKHVAIQYIKLITVIYVLKRNFRQNLHFFHKCRCYLLLFTFKLLHFDKLYFYVFGDVPRITCRDAAWCGLEFRWRHIFSFWIFQSQPVPNSSVDPMQMKSSMTIHL